jgi:hypothetical protein
MLAKRDYRAITLDVLELAEQTLDRDVADSLRQLVVAYNALVRSNEQPIGRSSTTLADHHGLRERVSADDRQRLPPKPSRRSVRPIIAPQLPAAIKPC